MHCFEIRTANVDYYVGEDQLYGVKDPTKVIMPPLDTGIGTHLAKSWETTIRQSLMPVTPQTNIPSKTEYKRCTKIKTLSHFLCVQFLCVCLLSQGKMTREKIESQR